MSRNWRQARGLWLPEYGRPAGFPWRPPQRRMSSAAGTGVPTAPVITSVSPTTAQPGTVLTVSGVGFGASQGAGGTTLGGVSAPVDTWSDTTITATAPAQTSYPTTAPVVVTTNSGSSSPSGQSVTTTTPTAPAIISLSATSGAPGSSLTITGVDFGAARGFGTVKINNVAATVTGWGDTSITVTVPSQVSYPATGSVVVTTDGGQTATSAGTFTTTAPYLLKAAQPGNTNSFLSVANDANVDVSGGDFTVSVWIKASAAVIATNPTFLGKWGAGGGTNSVNAWDIYHFSGAIWIGFAKGTTRQDLSAGVALAADTWTNVTFWVSGTTLSCSVNGGAATSATILSGGCNSTTNPVVFGGLGANGGGVSSYFLCNVDSFGLWRRALTATERGHLYNSGVGLAWLDIAGTYTSMNDATMWLDMDEAANANRLDATGNGHTAVDVNSSVPQVAGIR